MTWASKNRVPVVVMLAFVVLGSVGLLAQTARTVDVAFKAARHIEEVEGDLHGAIDAYATLAQGSDRAIAAQALVRMAACYEKLGEPDARDVYQRVLRDYADQADPAAEARDRLERIVEAARGALAGLGQATPHDELRELPEPGTTYSVAPDGRRGAFTAITGEGMNIGVINYETGEITWITDLEWAQNNGVADIPIWAPDSRRLAYSQVTPDGITEIRVVVPGEIPRMIFRNEGRRSPRGVTAMVSDWVRDGSALVVSAHRGDGSNTLGLVSLEDGSFTQLRTVPWQGFEDFPKASLDGRFVLIQEHGDLFLLATDGSEKAQLTDHPAVDADAVWSGDGNHVLFTSDRGGTMGLWALPVEDGRRAGTPFLVRAPWRGSFLGWTGDELAFGTSLNIQNIYTVPVDPQSGETTGEAKLIPYPDTGGYLQFPRWSADGREIAFLADANSTSARVVIQPLDGGRAREYLVREDVRYPMTVLRWLPDGTGISFMARNRQGRPILVRGALAEGTWETAPLPQKTNTDADAFAWSATGDSFYFTRGANDLSEGSSRLIEHDLATGEEEVLHAAEGGIEALALSPGGGELAFQVRPFPCCLTDTWRRGFWVLSLETGSVRRVAPEWNEGSRSWSPDGWHLPFGCGQNEERGICIVDLVAGNVTNIDLNPGEVFSKTMGPIVEAQHPVDQGPAVTWRDFLWSPAGDRLLFIIHAQKSQVMIMADPLAAAALDGQPSSGQRR